MHAHHDTAALPSTMNMEMLEPSTSPSFPRLTTERTIESMSHKISIETGVGAVNVAARCSAIAWSRCCKVPVKCCPEAKKLLYGVGQSRPR